MSVTGDGVAVASAAFDGLLGSTAIGVGCATDGSRSLYGMQQNIRIWQRQLPNAVLQAITT